MFGLTELLLTAPSPPRSLFWQGNQLVDWVAGGDIFGLDASYQNSHIRFSYRFDAAIASPSGRFALIHERLGTKGLLLDHGRHLREVNRSYYFANAYEYPAVFLTLPGGREALVHCPQEYNQLEVHDAASGASLMIGNAADHADFFHSRLQASPNGRWLASAGWVGIRSTMFSSSRPRSC